MHRLSRKDLSSAELETLQRSINPTTGITANGEVQTNEEAQENVHGLELFVTDQILEDTPAVLSLGKLCEEHGYSNEWASGQKHQLSKTWKITPCNAEIFVPVVVPGLSTSLPHHSSGPATQRSNDTHAEASVNRGDPTKTTKQKIKTRAVIKQRVSDCAISQSERSSQKNLEGTEVPDLRDTPANPFSRFRFGTSYQKWYQGSTVFVRTCQKTDFARSAREPRIQGLFAGSALAKQYLEQKNSVT